MHRVHGVHRVCMVHRVCRVHRLWLGDVPNQNV